jgi:hypothetical protein
VSNCHVRGCGRGHNYLLHDVLQNEEVMMVSALPGRVSESESVLRCRQMVTAENEGQCFRLNVLYDWGATVSMISEEAVEVMGLAITKQAKRIIQRTGRCDDRVQGHLHSEPGGLQRGQEDRDGMGGWQDSLTAWWSASRGRG